MANLVDIYLVYRILRRLTQPFTEWEAYKLGVIDAEGNILKKGDDRATMDEKDSLTKFDLLILKLKKILGMLPYGKTKIASYAAALWFLKEEKRLTEENLEEEFFKMQLNEDWSDKYKKSIDCDNPKGFSQRAHCAGRKVQEEVPVNSAGSGGVAGLDANPPVGKKAQAAIIRRAKFANNDVFVVDNETFKKARLGKQKYTKYERYVGTDPVGQAIREFGRKYPSKPIILQDGESGPMMFLRHGKRTMFKEWVSLQEEITSSDLKTIEQYADKLFKAVGIDVAFTRHFLDRVNDERNRRQITTQELTNLFRKTYEKHGKRIPKLGPDAEAVISDMASDINMPFVLKWDRDSEEFDLVAKTVMRKRNFMTSNPKITV